MVWIELFSDNVIKNHPNCRSHYCGRMSSSDTQANTDNGAIVPPISTNSNNPPLNFNDVLLSDFEPGEDGSIATFQGVALVSLTAKHLRTLASKLKISGSRTGKKETLVASIQTVVKNRKAYQQLDDELGTGENNPSCPKTRKEVHCSFRLMNVLFSDKFMEDLSKLGNIASRAVLDSGKAGNDQHFWERVQQEYQVENDLYSTLQFNDCEVFVHSEINPSKIIKHDWKKLRTIWKALVSDYKAALSRFTLSGTHDSDFYNFCHGNIEILYLRKYLELRPQVVGYVEADLPPETFMDSSAISSDSNGDVEAPPSSSKKRKTSISSDVIDAIKDLGSNCVQNEIAKQRLELLQKEQERKVKVDKEQSQYRKDKTERMTRESQLSEWERLQQNITNLRKEMNEVDEEGKVEIQEDIQGLKKRKQELGRILGFN